MRAWQRRTRTACSLEVPRERAFAVLADDPRYPEWIPGLEEAHILAREGDVAVLEIRAPRFRAEKIVLELIHSPPEEIRFREVLGYGKPKIAGRCELRDDDGGTRLEVDLRVATRLAALGSGRRLRDAVAEAMAALAERTTDVEAGRVAAPGEKRKVLEIFERDGTLEIRLRGESYRLVKVDGDAGGR